MVLTNFGPFGPQFGSFITLREASRGLVACKGRLGDLAIFGRFGVKNDPKISFQMCLGILWGVIYDVSGWFCRIFGLPDPNLGL